MMSLGHERRWRGVGRGMKRFLAGEMPGRHCAQGPEMGKAERPRKLVELLDRAFVLSYGVDARLASSRPACWG